MTRLSTIFTGLVATTLITTNALAETREAQRIDDSIQIFQKFTAIPEKSIPANILAQAYGVAVIPGVIKAGFIIAGRGGAGILSVRQADGSWGNPTFITIGGGSVGLQVGGQSTDLVLVFRSPKSIEHIANGNFTIGGDASAAAGPVGRSAASATDWRFGAEIYSYSRNRGLFAGFSIDGTYISIDKRANQAFYQGDYAAMQILTDPNLPKPIQSRRFAEVLTAHTERVDLPADSSRSASISGSDSDDGVKTYAID